MNKAWTTEWQSHLIYVSAQLRSSLGLCASNTHDCTSTYQENSSVKNEDDATVISCITNNNESSYWEEINNLQSGAQRTVYCSPSANPSWMLERRRQRHTPLSTSVGLRWSRWTVLDCLPQRSCHNTFPPCLRMDPRHPTGDGETAGHPMDCYRVQ